jgi:hypothetical protein
MPINSKDGRFALDCWLDPKSTDHADSTEYAQTEAELRERIPKILQAGRFKSLMLYRFNPNTLEWDEIEEFSEDDLKS